MKAKRFIAALLAMVFVAAVAYAQPVEANPVQRATFTVTVDGFEMTTSALISGGHVLVPFRFLEDAVGAVTAYNPTTRGIHITTAGFGFRMVVGQTRYHRNGTIGTLPVAPVLSGRVPYVPLVNVIRGIGGEITINVAERTVQITYFTGLEGTVVVSGSTTLYPFMVAAADHLNSINPDLTVNVAAGGSSAGRNAVIAGTSHLGMDSGFPNAAQQAQMRAPIPVAFDAVAIAVHPSNPIENLTSAQARSIFLGEITNWNQVGGNNAPIIVHVRDGLSGTAEIFRSNLLGGTDWVATATPHASNGLQRNAVANDPNAIAFLSVGYLDSTVSGISLDGIVPNFETVSRGRYPLSRNLYLLSRQMPTGASARVVDFIRSAHGQQIVFEAEFLPIRPMR